MSESATLAEIASYQARLRPGCFLSLRYGYGVWSMAVETQGNRWPHWQAAAGPSPDRAWARLKAFLDGGEQLHGEKPCSAADFLTEGG